MQATMSRDMKSYFSYIVCLLLLFSVLPLNAREVYLCVWRNPERTMTRIFPEAKDYKTIAVPISEEQRKAIEKKLGFELLPGQQDRFQYFEMTGTEGEVIGIIIAASQKGQYGAVEFVFGLDNDFTIRDIYVQRARERNSSFKKRAFLDLFKGQSIREADNVETIYSGESTPGTEAVFRGIVKEIVAFNILVPKN